MMPVGMLLIAAMPLLVLSSEIQQCSSHITHHMSPELDSLKCYNDYTTHVRCTWEEEPHTHSELVIDNINACVPDGQSVQLSSGKLSRNCVFKTGLFHWSNVTVFFNTSCPSKARSINISQQGKALSPINVSVTEDAGGGKKVTWSSPYTLSSHKLTYQLKYRRSGHDWTVVGNISGNHSVIEKNLLWPGYSYEARVRARRQEGLWSDWSPPVSWITEEEGAYNLQCVLEEAGVSCSWQVKRKHAQFITYYLCSQTRESKQFCKPCVTSRTQPGHAVLDFTCSVDSSEPELLTVALKSIRNSKNIIYPEFIQSPRPGPVTVQEHNGLWKFTWSRPNVNKNLLLSYELRLHNKNTQKDELKNNFSEGGFSHTVVPSKLQHATYMAQVRAFPSYPFDGRPSDWSEPVDFQNNPVSWTTTVIYIVIAVFVAMLFVVLYNTLPACHRRLEVWKVSIPSPIKSRVLEDMSSKRSPPPEGYVCSSSEKTSVCIMQPSDNPIIYKGSISECPLLPNCDKGSIKPEWTDSSGHSCPYIEGSGMSVKSSMSFTGPYIFCRQDSAQTEILDMSSFYSDSTFAEDCRSITDNDKDSPPLNGGYVSSPPASLASSEHSAQPDKQADEDMKLNVSQLPMCDPPVYTPNPTAIPGAIFSHPSGYFLMPSMEQNVVTWVQASTPPSGCDMVCQSNDAEGDQRARGYVTLSERKT